MKITKIPDDFQKFRKIPKISEVFLNENLPIVGGQIDEILGVKMIRVFVPKIIRPGVVLGSYQNHKISRLFVFFGRISESFSEKNLSRGSPYKSLKSQKYQSFSLKI